MNPKNLEPNNNGLEFLIREYNSLSIQLLVETISFRLILFFWTLAMGFLPMPSGNFLIGAIIISLTIATLWASIIDRTKKSRKRLEIAITQYSIEKNSALEKIYVEWQYENIHPVAKMLYKQEPYVWFLITVVLLLVKVYL